MEHNFSHLLHPVRVKELVMEWLKEDTPNFDYGGFVVGDKTESAVLLCKGCGVLAGVPFFEAVFNELGCNVEWLIQEGAEIKPKTTVAKVTGKAVKDARKACGFSTKIEVECRSISEAVEASLAGADVVMLDNFEPEALINAAVELKTRFPHVLLESSGGVTEETITSYMGPNVDIISLSRSTQGYSTVDFSLKIVRQGKDPSNPLVKHPHLSK